MHNSERRKKKKLFYSFETEKRNVQGKLEEQNLEERFKNNPSQGTYLLNQEENEQRRQEY